MSDALAHAGLSEREAARKAALFHLATSALQSRGLVAGDLVHAWVPGRIEFLGKHTDYAGGRSLLCAIERGFCVVGARRADRRLNVIDARNGDMAALSLDLSASAPAGHWGNYPLTVARRIALNFGEPLAGADVAFASDLPPAAGISSSSALVVATFLVLDRINALSTRTAYRSAIASREGLAEYLGAVENGLAYGDLAGERGVGTFGGSEDHTAILCAEPGALVQYSFCPVRLERTVDLPSDCVFVVASSGVVAEKSGAALASYNRLATLAHAGADRLRAATGSAASSLAGALSDARTAEPSRSLDAMLDDDALAERVRQFAIESEELVPAAADSLATGDLARLGAVVDRSMWNAADMLHNQIEETIYLARRARELAAIAASAFGAGFGGSVWALVRAGDADAFASALFADYRQRFPRSTAHAEVFVTRAVGGARLL
jgi:galactokinase